MRTELRSRLKRSGLVLCNGLGRILRPEGVPVLGYHSVANTDLDLSTPPAMFAAQMAYLQAQGFRVVSLKHWMAEAGTLPPDKMAVLTFDDGLNDFYEFAWPVLKQHDFSATVFVPTDFIGQTSHWYADYGLTPQPMMSWDALREVTEAGIDIQSHGCSHRPLTTLAENDLREELTSSKDVLEQGLGRSADYFCCPQGAWDSAVMAGIKQAGYKGAVIGENGLNRGNAAPYQIKRQLPDMISITDEKTALLSIEACIRGTFAWYVNTRKTVKNLF